MERLMLSYAAQEKIRACYSKGIDSLVSKGQLSTERGNLLRAINNDLIDLQLKPKSMFWHTPHNLARHHILEAYPRNPKTS
jgi:hypothetical protein